MPFPRSTHQWLRHVYAALNGRTYLSLGSPTGAIGLYGATGTAGQLATGTAGITGWTGAGSSTVSQIWFNGGTGTFYTISDLVLMGKNAGLLKP